MYIDNRRCSVTPRTGNLKVKRAPDSQKSAENVCSEASEASSVPRDRDYLIRCTYCKFAPCKVCISFRTKQAVEGVLFVHLIIKYSAGEKVRTPFPSPRFHPSSHFTSCPRNRTIGGTSVSGQPWHLQSQLEFTGPSGLRLTPASSRGVSLSQALGAPGRQCRADSYSTDSLPCGDRRPESCVTDSTPPHDSPDTPMI